MLRDPGPNHSLGFSVTSRDVPTNEGEKEGVAPNSGYIASALNGHPIMRFFAVSAATMAGTMVASKVVKKGGLKLAKYLQDGADNAAKLGESNFSTSIVKSVTDIRRHLDELQGLSRSVGTEDPYSKIVFELPGKHGPTLTTGSVDEIHGYKFFTNQDIQDAGADFLQETSAAVWSYRDELQQRLIRAGRRLPYELPAMYGVQRVVTDPLFGNRDESKRKVNWYNPVDVVADFTKTSLTNIATMMLPFEFAGATANQAKNSLHSLKYAVNDMRRITPYQKAAYKGFTDLSDILSEVGQDFASVTNKFLKKSAQTSSALSAATDAYKNQNEFVQNLSQLRSGVGSAINKTRAQTSSRMEIAKTTFKSIFGGYDDGSMKYASIFELAPSFKGMPGAVKAGRDEFRLIGKAYDAMESSIAFNKVISNTKRISVTEDSLSKAINRIQSMHSSRLSSFAEGMRILGGGGPDNSSFKRSEFFLGQQQTAFKDLIEKQLISKNLGIDPAEINKFVNNAKVRIPTSGADSTTIFTIGKTKIYPSANSAASASDDFFGQVLKRYGGIRNGKSLSESLQPNVLKQSIDDARDIFVTREFQKTLRNKTASQWNKMYRSDLLNIGEGVLKPKKALFQDYIQPNTYAKQNFLQRKTAQTLGIKLADDDGLAFADSLINKQLASRGIDPNNFTDLRAFLIRNKKMTSGVFGGGYNLFGLQPLSISEAFDKGRFSHMREDERKIIGALAGRQSMDEPIGISAVISRLDGVYKTKAGEIVDFTSIKSTFTRAANFFASEFKIPILGFNPTDLFGYNSFAEMSKRSPVQYISSRSVQPFLGAEKNQTRADFYLWAKSKGTKGKLIRFEGMPGADQVYGTTLPGLYRAMPSNSADLLTRHTRYASGEQGFTTDEIGGGIDKKFRGLRKHLSVDPEQPNSLFGALKRFSQRRKDPNNLINIAKRLQSQNFDVNDPQFLKSYSEFFDTVSKFGTSPKVMAELEKQNPQLFQLLGRGASSITSSKEAVEFAEQILQASTSIEKNLRAQNIDPKVIKTAKSRISNLLDQSNLDSVSQLSKTSPTITTRLDELREEIFRYIGTVNQATQNLQGNDIFIEVINAVNKLQKSGVISKSQMIEAQAAGLASLMNYSAFKTYSNKVDVFTSAKAAATAFSNSRKGLESLFDPFVNGTIGQVSGTMSRKFSPLIAPFARRYEFAKYQTSDLAIDPLGSGQSVTAVPTFGTVFGRNPYAATKSALGLTTYSDPEGFSGLSIAASQGVERLNRYFGSVGLQLNVTDFKGPLDLFARGMVMKRVLPLYAAGTTALTVDRTLGGMVNDRDDRGERVYSPLMLGAVARGAVEAQALGAGLTPGGMTYEEKKEQLVEGKVPIRQGRFWPLGNQPFVGGKVMYYRPSWYRKLQGGAMFTSDTYGSPAEKFLFYNDISPLRPFDPYRFERKHYNERPYPVSGEYFTGPFGPITPILNATVGRVLKPQVLMHEQEVSEGLASYLPVGQSGAYSSVGYSSPGYDPRKISYGGYGQGFGGGIGSYRGGSSGQVASTISAANSNLAARAGSTNMAGGMVTQSISNINSNYLSAYQFGPPKVRGVMNPEIIAAGSPIMPGSTYAQSSETAYRVQEMLGIYGFAFGALRESFGFGQSDFEPQRSVLQSASKAYGSGRAFWDLNLGGLGDIPLPSQTGIGNVEFSEIVRRFIPKERTGIDYINPIQNLMGKQYPFLPGAEYFTDFTRGDPFTKIQEGEIRLPGVGYERFNKITSDETGRYGLINQLEILGDVAPYSQQYKNVNATLNQRNLSAEERLKIKEIRDQVEKTTQKYEFSDYKYKNSSAEELGMRPAMFQLKRAGELIAHSDNFVANKLFGKKTALEDWERNNIYGSTFPEWQRPFESYIKPMVYEASQSNPITAAASLAVIGGMFGRTPRAKLFGSTLGTVTGLSSSIASQVSEAVTGERFIPLERKKQLALEEYTDILNYVKNSRLAAQAKEAGDSGAAAEFASAAGRTMYGMDLSRLQGDRARMDMVSLAVPKRKREHFKAMINATGEDREKILSTSGRLERRLYQAAWGMNIEKRPELADYFSRHELPDASWEGWLPNTNIDSVKIKIGQSMGLQMSQMGYYPQQIKEANLVNPSYPTFNMQSDRTDVTTRLRSLMSGMGISGTVTPVINPFGSQQIDVFAGVQ
jgi:hypothetical protein